MAIDAALEAKGVGGYALAAKGSYLFKSSRFIGWAIRAKINAATMLAQSKNVFQAR